MEYRPLGHTGIQVSKLCLGTMTWGEQNSEAEGWAQMDRALAAGVNIFDTAEMYPIQISAATQGETERIIGNWFKARGTRDQVVLASKVTGPGPQHIRDGKTRFDAATITEAIEGSLKRLQSDYIDLYQLHWPDRGWTDFSSLGQTVPLRNRGADRDETLHALDALIKAGKIRAWGLSNESAWGMMDFLSRCDALGIARPVTVQNAYSLLNRKYETGSAEVSLREEIGLFPYAPLAAGVLSGKYLNNARPAGARMTLWPGQTRYFGERVDAAIKAYQAVAADFGLDLVTLSHAFVMSRPFVTSSIMGATNLEQLEAALDSVDVGIPEGLMQALDKVHQDYTYLCP